MAELTDSLRSFYSHAGVDVFLKKNAFFYRGAVKEAAKDVRASVYPFMEKWFGERFPQYILYITPSMPITAGEDNYRGFGPGIVSDKGTIPSMVISSSRMLPLLNSLDSYRQFGFDNPAVTSFLSGHEIGHSFVNHLLDSYAAAIQKDTALYTPALKAILEPHYINNWYVCVIEHLVRLGEIRVAVSMNDGKEADRLRKLHIGEYKCVLLPLLEKKIETYEHNRERYPDFKSYLPELIAYLHSLTPDIINEQVSRYSHYPEK